jgi:hypothetical protein
MLTIPTFPEANHQILRSLTVYSDRELVSLHTLHPEQGKFFTAFFCRYSSIVYSVVRHAVESERQANYLFALAWQDIFHQLRSVKLSADPDAINWQNWAIDITAGTIDRVEVPAADRVNYELATAPPPLRCYLERGLDLLAPLVRTIVVMHQCFKWNEQRICAYLEGEGEKIAVDRIPLYLAEGYRQLEANLPQDIQEIYLQPRSIASAQS